MILASLGADPEVDPCPKAEIACRSLYEGPGWLEVSSLKIALLKVTSLEATLLEAPLIEANLLELTQLDPEQLPCPRQPGLIVAISFKAA